MRRGRLRENPLLLMDITDEIAMQDKLRWRNEMSTEEYELVSAKEANRLESAPGEYEPAMVDPHAFKCYCCFEYTGRDQGDRGGGMRVLCDIIDKNSELSQLIEDILDFQRLRCGTLTLRREISI